MTEVSVRLRIAATDLFVPVTRRVVRNFQRKVGSRQNRVDRPPRGSAARRTQAVHVAPYAMRPGLADRSAAHRLPFPPTLVAVPPPTVICQAQFQLTVCHLDKLKLGKAGFQSKWKIILFTSKTPIGPPKVE